MSEFFKKKLNKIKPYKVYSHDAWSKGDPNLIKADWNESDVFFWPKEIFDLSIEDLKLHWYPNLYNKKLIKSISNYINIPFENIFYSNSSDIVHECLLKILIDDGDKVLSVVPTYDNFRLTVEINNGVVENINWNDIENIDLYIKKYHPKIVYICNPNNPTGNFLNLEFLEEKVLKHKKVLFIIDEAYYEFSKLESSVKLSSNYSNIVTTRTLSKAFGLAGLRLGYCCASKEIINKLFSYSNPKQTTTITQILSIKALNNIKYLDKHIDNVIENYYLILDAFKNKNIEVIIGEVPTNFILFKPESSRIKEIIKILVKNSINIRDLSHVNFLEDTLRISIPGDKTNCKRILNAINSF